MPVGIEKFTTRPRGYRAGAATELLTAKWTHHLQEPARHPKPIATLALGNQVMSESLELKPSRSDPVLDWECTMNTNTKDVRLRRVRRYANITPSRSTARRAARGEQDHDRVRHQLARADIAGRSYFARKNHYGFRRRT